MITAVLHMAGAVAWWFAVHRAGMPHPKLIAAAAAMTLALAFGPIVLETFPDRPRSRWRVRLVELPYLTHWCALVPALLVLPVAGAVWTVQQVLHSVAPISIGAWAWRAYGAGLIASFWGVFARRHMVRVRHFTARIAGLHSALAGFKIVQLSDLHIGTYTSSQAARGWVRRANALGADLVVVTGDLVSGGAGFHREIADVLAELRAPEGVAVIPGNHEYFGDGETLFGMLTARGVRVLRNQSFVVRRGAARLNVVGVDDVWTRRANVAGAMANTERGSPTVLLAHDPALFPRAAERGADLVLSGHTHGGQIAIPFLARWLNLSAWAHRYQLGVYHEGGSTLVVSAGLGTTGPPIRLGVAPELVVVELRPGG